MTIKSKLHSNIRNLKNNKKSLLRGGSSTEIVKDSNKEGYVKTTC